MNRQPAGTLADDIILMFGLSVAEDRAVSAYLATRAEQSKRERLTLSARWVLTHGRGVTFDSKGRALDPDTDWPLSPLAGAMPETQGSCGVAVRMAKGRRTRHAKLAALADATGFRLSSIKLAGVPPLVDAQARGERRGSAAMTTFR